MEFESENIPQKSKKKEKKRKSKRENESFEEPNPQHSKSFEAPS